MVNAVYHLDGQFYGGEQLAEGSLSIPGTVTAGDRFGFSLAFTQLIRPPVEGVEQPGAALLVGAPGETVNGHPNAGAVFALDAFDAIPSTAPVQQYTQNSPGVPGAAETGTNSATAWPAAGSARIPRRRGTSPSGAPGENLGAAVDAGLVTVFSSVAGGWKPIASLTQDTSGVPGTAESGDRFGHALAFVPQVSGSVTPRRS